MNWMEHGMTSHKLLQWPPHPIDSDYSPRPSRFQRLRYESRVHWKEALVALTFWAVYCYACVSWLSR
jgi:hypothetical protein